MAASTFGILTSNYWQGKKEKLEQEAELTTEGGRLGRER